MEGGKEEEVGGGAATAEGEEGTVGKAGEGVRGGGGAKVVPGPSTLAMASSFAAPACMMTLLLYSDVGSQHLHAPDRSPFADRR